MCVRERERERSILSGHSESDMVGQTTHSLSVTHSPTVTHSLSVSHSPTVTHSLSVRPSVAVSLPPLPLSVSHSPSLSLSLCPSVASFTVTHSLSVTQSPTVTHALHPMPLTHTLCLCVCHCPSVASFSASHSLSVTHLLYVSRRPRCITTALPRLTHCPSLTLSVPHSLRVRRTALGDDLEDRVPRQPAQSLTHSVRERERE